MYNFNGQMNGILVIDKPAGITSHTVVSRVRRTLGTRRVGHTGTLDPFATGVMVLVIGSSSRLARFIDKDEKEYRATVRFGYATDTGDLTGSAISEGRLSENEVGERLKAADLEAVLAGFLGESEQVPPMYSAKKVAGRKLYDLARRGKTIERKPARVTISEIETLAIYHDLREIEISVICSAGTYIRALAVDIGLRLGIPAHLSQLRRMRSGQFSIDDAVCLSTFEAATKPDSYILPPDIAVSRLPSFVVPEDRVRATLCGLSTRMINAEHSDGEDVRMLSPNGELLAIAKYDSAESSLHPTIVLH